MSHPLSLRRRDISTRLAALLSLALVQIAIAQSTTAPASSQSQSAPLHFTLTYDPAITDSFTGRVYVLLNRSGGGGGRGGEPRFGPGWFSNEPIFSLDVINWKPATPLIIDDAALSYPTNLSNVPQDEYNIQAVMRRNLDSPAIGTAPGTAYSTPAQNRVGGGINGNIDLRIDKKVPPQSPPKDTERIKYAELRSNLLSSFFHRDITMRASIILPNHYNDDPKRQYPGMYWIGGFGSDHRDYRPINSQWERTGLADHIIRIVLDPSCYGGHHVFADSENNGPRGQALIEEFIPYLEKTFRLVASPDARFLSGHSSGGWSSLWLQVAYPDFFGGVWSIAPDPVDFRDFQRIDLYQPGINMYFDDQGAQRPIARQGGRPFYYYQPFAKAEVPYGDGGQLRSFEWVFSKRTPDKSKTNAGQPEMLFDRDTGLVNAQVAESWKRYDIRLILEQNWPVLGPKLSGGGKLHVFVGDEDTFYLDGAVKLLKESMEGLHSQAVVEIVPGRDHGSIASMELRQRIDRELIEDFNKHHPEFALPSPAYD